VRGRRLVLRGLVRFRRTHLGALGAAALTAAVIVTALSVGDSVRSGMVRADLARTGRAGYAAHARDRTWRAALAASLAERLGVSVHATLTLDGTVSLPDGSARIARGRVHGVPESFWALAPGGSAPLEAWPEDGAAVSESVAERLGVSVGDTLVVRPERPAAVPRETPLSGSGADAATLSVTVAAVLDSAAFGSFSLEIGALAPANLFLPIERLQRVVEAPGRANTLLIEAHGLREADLERAVRASFRLDDAGLSLRRLDRGRGWQLSSRRVLLDPPAAAAALGTDGATGVLTWLVNELAAGERHTPYSIVAALPRGCGPVPEDLGDDEIVLNSWLAGDLAARAGDTVRLTYFVLGQARRLEERSSSFRVRTVVPIEGAAADPDLMPDFPGLAGSENCRDWDPGFVLDLDRIRDEDEAYWDEHRGTPKAFLSLRTGRALWGNRFGSLTAVRFPPDTDRTALEAALADRLDPAAFGLRFVDLRATAADAREKGADFGPLFLGFSAFLVGAALLLMGLVTALNLAMRREEAATLRALGFPSRRIRRLFAAEHAVVALAGGVAGAVAGPALAGAALGALNTVWSDVAGSLELSVVVRPVTLIAGGSSGAAVAFAAAFLVLRSAVRRSVADALTRDEALATRVARSRARRCAGLWVALGFAVAAVTLAVLAGTGRDPATAGAFFGSGALLLFAALSLTWYALGHLGRGRRVSDRGLAWRNLGRRRGRSLAVVGVLAFGVFMFFGVSVFRRDRLDSGSDPASGTGGFELVGESATALVRDLNTPEGRRFHALSDADLEGVRVVGLRVRRGDDASCRSLTRAVAPPVVGVDPRALAGRFTFVAGADGREDPWKVLAEAEEGGPVPAVIDQATFWTLGKGHGDEIELGDERGRPFRARIAGVIDNSVLHGRIVVSEAAFRERFLSASGYRLFLVDTPPERTDVVAAVLTRHLEDRGMALARSEAVLNSYNAVENTYLGIFQALGGLGLLLGSAGLALVVGRNVFERRRELALLGALGFPRRRILGLVTREHLVLLGLGLAAGVLSSLLSILPAILAPGARLATPAIAVTLVALGAGGALWTLLAARLALRGRLLDALRDAEERSVRSN
jgi:predicted lysophospholipase L1 biosynthesis ABC-type transport system permease subunit